MTTVGAALAAMDTAEQEAHDHLDGDDPQDVEYGEWAADRLRLIQRDKATLERHYRVEVATRFPRTPDIICDHCSQDWPCPDATAVMSYWTEER